MGDTIRPGNRLNVCDSAHRHHLVLRISSVEPADLIRLRSKIAVSLNVYLIGAAEKIEVVDIKSAKIGLQGVEDVRDRHLEPLHFCPVDIDKELGYLRAQRRVDLG